MGFKRVYDAPEFKYRVLREDSWGDVSVELQTDYLDEAKEVSLEFKRDGYDSWVEEWEDE